MFLGREVYTAKFQSYLLEAKVFQNKENVNQTFKRLEKKRNYLKFLRIEEDKPGNPHIYTAYFDPIFKTFNSLNIECEERWFERLVCHTSFLNDYFPKFLVKVGTFGGIKDFSTKGLSWEITLTSYLLHLALRLLLSQCHPLVMPKKPKPGTPSLVIDFMNLISTAKYIEDDPVGLQLKQKVAKVASNNPSAGEKVFNIAMKVSLLQWGFMSQNLSLLLKAMQGTHTEK